MDSNETDSEEEDEDERGEQNEENKEENAIDIALTIQQGSFLPAIGLISKGMIDPKKFIVDFQTGG